LPVAFRRLAYWLPIHVHWVRPEMVVEVSYLTWTEDGLLRQVVYLGEREDKPAEQVIRAPPQRVR